MKRFALLAATAALLLGPASPAAASPDSAHHGRGAAGIFWFLHISDSHIGASQLVYPHAPDHLEFALNDVVATVGPAFVVNSGDLVDGSANEIPTSGQEQAEWSGYRSIVDQAGMTADFYFDLPGNHDGYNDVGMTYYLANSLQGQTNGSLFTDWVVTTPVAQHYFFGFNSNGNGSGPGIVAPDGDPEFTHDEIAALDAGLQANSDAQLVFTFGHHNLGMCDNGGQVVDLLSSNGGAFYLHGHRHDYTEYLQGSNSIVANEVDTLGKGSVNNLGIGVVDHNAFIYRAQDVVGPWPFVIVTAPVSRNIRGTSAPHPYAYDVCLDRPDNPFRAVVFSPQVVTDVTVEVDPTIPATPMSLAAGSTVIWEAEIDTSSLAPGPHDVTVTAWVDDGFAQHVVNSAFVPGPCDPLPDDGDIPVGGFGGAGGTGATGGSGGAVGTGGALGGFGGGSVGGEAPLLPDIDDEGGCTCRVVAGRSSGSAMELLFAIGLVGCAGLRRRRD